MAVIAFPIFLLMNTRNAGLIILGILLVALAHSIQYGPQASYIAESFPTRLGYAGSCRTVGTPTSSSSRRRRRRLASPAG